MNTMKTMNIKLMQKSATAVQLTQEAYSVIVDRPIENGGGGQGIIGGKYLLIGIGGCFCSTLLAAAQSRNIRIDELTVEVTANLSAEAPLRFTDIQITVDYLQNADYQHIKKLIAIDEKGCTVINTIKTGVNFKAGLKA